MARTLSVKAGGILSYFVRHRTVANLLLILLLAAGAFSIPNMRAQFFPDVVVDDVDVSVVWEGAGAEDVDRGIVQVLEPAVLSVEGVESSEASAREGRASTRARATRADHCLASAWQRASAPSLGSSAGATGAAITDTRGSTRACRRTPIGSARIPAALSAPEE